MRRTPDRPSQRLPRRQGSVLAAVTSVLEAAAGPMRLQDIHRAVEDRTGEPIPYLSVKDALAAHTSGNARRFRRTHRGCYELS